MKPITTLVATRLATLPISFAGVAESLTGSWDDQGDGTYRNPVLNADYPDVDAELIKRGRRGRPIEFGHKVLLTQSREKFITDYVVLEECCSDNTLLTTVIERHEERFGSVLLRSRSWRTRDSLRTLIRMKNWKRKLTIWESLAARVNSATR